MIKLSNHKLKESFNKLELKVGDIVFVLSDLDQKVFGMRERRLLIKNLREFLGKDGTIIMDLSGSNLDFSSTASLDNLKDVMATRDLMPAYSKDQAQLYATDFLATTLLLEKDVVISDSPSYPFVGVGKYANLISTGQSNDFPNGNMSPLARLYELRAKTLMINADVTLLNLNKFVFETDYNSVIKINGGASISDDVRVWSKFLEKSIDSDKLEKIIKTSNFKRLFYFADVDDLTLLTTEVRTYVDYCREILKETKWKRY